jgi:hypothetical protein
VRRDWLTVLGKLAVIVFVLALVGLSIWAWIAAPCSWYRFSHAKDIPGRCIVWVKQ